MDAIATPFVQGRLWRQDLSVVLETECAHCQTPLHLEMDQKLNINVREENAAPMAFMPIVNFSKLEAPSIIDDF